MPHEDPEDRGFRKIVPLARVQLLTDALTQFPGEPGAFMLGYATEGDEGADIGGPHAGMYAAMLAHVDLIPGGGDELKCPLRDGIWLAGEGEDGAIRALAAVTIQQIAAVDRFNAFGEAIQADGILPFAHIGNTFDNWHREPPRRP